jgi:hypothetical protein
MTENDVFNLNNASKRFFFIFLLQQILLRSREVIPCFVNANLSIYLFNYNISNKKLCYLNYVSRK